MHVGVIGLGNFGSAVAIKLFELGHQVTALDLNERAVARVQDQSDQAVVADATQRRVLEDLGLGLADCAVVSLGTDMAASILCTLHLQEMKLKRIVAKAISSDHEKILKKVGAGEVIFPEREAARRLATALVDPNLLDYLPIGKEFSVAELAPPTEFVGKTLTELSLRATYGVNVIAVRELAPEHISLVVRPSYVVKQSDVLIVVGRQEDIESLPKETK